MTVALPRRSQKYFEIDVDIHTWGSAPLKGLDTVKSKMAQLALRSGVFSVVLGGGCETGA